MAKTKMPASAGKGQKKFPLAKAITAVVIVTAVAALTVFLVMKTHADNARFALKNTHWISKSALNASGDEVDVREVYNVRYSNYQGRLDFDGDNHFELWLAPGDVDDGTHTGTYELKENSVTAAFDEGTVVQFDVVRENGKIERIDVGYDDYTVCFYPAEN